MTAEDKKPKPGSARTARGPNRGRKDLFRPRLPGEGDPPDIDLGHLDPEDDEDTGTDESGDGTPKASEGAQERAAAARNAQADYDRKDRTFTEVKFGQPRIAVLSDRSLSVMRLAPTPQPRCVAALETCAPSIICFSRLYGVAEPLQERITRVITEEICPSNIRSNLPWLDMS